MSGLLLRTGRQERTWARLRGFRATWPTASRRLAGLMRHDALAPVYHRKSCDCSCVHQADMAQLPSNNLGRPPSDRSHTSDGTRPRSQVSVLGKRPSSCSKRREISLVCTAGPHHPLTHGDWQNHVVQLLRNRKKRLPCQSRVEIPDRGGNS